MNDKDKKTVERIIYYCNRLQEHILFFGNSKRNILLIVNIRMLVL